MQAAMTTMRPTRRLQLMVVSMCWLNVQLEYAINEWSNNHMNSIAVIMHHSPMITSAWLYPDVPVCHFDDALYVTLKAVGWIGQVQRVRNRRSKGLRQAPMSAAIECCCKNL